MTDQTRVPERDYEIDMECVKVVLRHQLKHVLDAYYEQWKSEEISDQSREHLLDRVARDVLQMLRLWQRTGEPYPDREAADG